MAESREVELDAGIAACEGDVLAGLGLPSGGRILAHAVARGQGVSRRLRGRNRCRALCAHGSDAAQVVKDFAKITTHMHLKDYSNGKYMGGYCPLGMGKVDIKQILDLVESGGQKPNIMVELDPSSKQPMTPLETAQTSKAYLQKLGYKFRT